MPSDVEKMSQSPTPRDAALGRREVIQMNIRGNKREQQELLVYFAECPDHGPEYRIFDEQDICVAAILFRPMIPFKPPFVRNFSELAVFISAGTADPIVSHNCPEQLAAVFESGGADVSLFWHEGGHELGDDDVIAAKKWLSDKAAKRLAA